jgi:hypothetical protein
MKTIKQEAQEIFKEAKHLQELIATPIFGFLGAEKDEQPHKAAPTDEEMDRMHDAWEFDMQQTERESYINAH